MIKPLVSLTVSPSIPQKLQCLLPLAYNLYWVWDPDLMDLFFRLDPDLWEATNHNPVEMLGKISQEKLNQFAENEAYLNQLQRACERLTEYMQHTSTWYNKFNKGSQKYKFAYFSAEFGITECLQNYSGGLGLLSGDHLKAASDLGVPLVGVGLLYQQGYFRQYLNVDGWQQERYPVNDFYVLPLKPEVDASGKPFLITIDFPGRVVSAKIWKVQVGRIPLYLLDTNIPENAPSDQTITDQLYGGDREKRIQQEILLGIGGYRALEALGISPTVYHINEGHSAFLTVEHCRALMQKYSISFHEAKEMTIASTVFTTHTPVPAGNDYFEPHLVEKYFSKYVQSLGISMREFLGLGRENPQNDGESFCMTILALRMSGRSNGVSKLHGKVSRAMWKNVWPNVPEDEIPITSITNAVHGPSWVSREMAGLFDRYLGTGWRENEEQQTIWNRITQIPDEELWRTHERRRERLVAFARQRLRHQLAARGATASEIAQAAEILNPEALTIGFARRFATYKRATLLLRNPDRLLKILSNKERPVQIIFSGKAHPLDNPGKELIRQIIHFERRPEARYRMVFIEDYDIVVARYIVQGVDVWLNTPRRPLEASGTSGMKAALNGALNVSILDGWWDEAYNPDVGWAIGRGEEYSDIEYQNEVESNALYDLLEKEIIPLFYTRSTDDLPRGWIAKMKSSMRAIGPVFNTSRMVRDYTEQLYLPAAHRAHELASNNFERVRKLATWKQKLANEWNNIKIEQMIIDSDANLKVGDFCPVRVFINLGNVSPTDVQVQIYYGPMDAAGTISNPHTVTITNTKKVNDSLYEFSGKITLVKSGRIGYTVRILPNHQDLINPFHDGLIKWG
ncbi:MAG: alpha-glucan family phosphorylase [Bacteroidetes bacterium]|nr:alpha-glucan family phosphorylase [Bacteroidota bacterium]